ncbi:YncE family protein [Actinomycetospora rhizophila]|uniref:YncE family protein n=1 Tax=Actinomycetospora rhizophila TaxID=1416876 RepID=A0ABV9Z9V4_9PSEU
MRSRPFCALLALLGGLLALSACTGPPPRPPAVDQAALTGALDMALTPDGTRAYIVWRGGVVSAMDVATSEQLWSVPVGATPSDVAVTPDGRVLVSTWADELVTVDPVARAVTARTPIPRQPDEGDAVSAPGSLEMVVTPDGSRAVLARGDAGVTTVDLRTMAATSSRPGTGEISDVVLLPDGTQLFSQYMRNVVIAVDPATGNQAWYAQVADARELVVSPDGGTAYVVSPRYGTIWVVDLATRQYTREIQPGLDADDVAIDATGRRLAVSDPGGRVVVVDAATGAPQQDALVDRMPSGLAFTPDGRRLVVVSAGAGVGSGTRSIELRGTGP